MTFMVFRTDRDEVNARIIVMPLRPKSMSMADRLHCIRGMTGFVHVLDFKEIARIYEFKFTFALFFIVFRVFQVRGGEGGWRTL